METGLCIAYLNTWRSPSTEWMIPIYTTFWRCCAYNKNTNLLYNNNNFLKNLRFCRLVILKIFSASLFSECYINAWVHVVAWMFEIKWFYKFSVSTTFFINSDLSTSFLRPIFVSQTGDECDDFFNWYFL